MKTALFALVLASLASSAMADKPSILKDGNELGVSIGIWEANDELLRAVADKEEVTDKVSFQSAEAALSYAFLIDDNGDGVTSLEQTSGQISLGAFANTSDGKEPIGYQLAGNPKDGGNGAYLEYAAKAEAEGVLSGEANVVYGDGEGKKRKFHDVKLSLDIPSDKSAVVFYTADAKLYAVVVDPTIKVAKEETKDEKKSDGKAEKKVDTKKVPDAKPDKPVTRSGSSRF